MAISPINVSRVSQSMLATFATASLQRNQRNLFGSEARIAMGRSYIVPSDDPIAAARALELAQARQRQDQFLANLRHGDGFLTAADDALSEVNSLLIQAQTLASKNVSNLISTEERRADAELIAGIRQQLQAVGNRLFDGRYIFAGRDTSSQPFVAALGGVAYVGDTGDLVTRISEDAQAVINMPGSALFGALSSQITADIDLTPALTPSVRLEDLRGPNGEGFVKGTVVFNEANAGTFSVNLDSADTVGDVVALINHAALTAGSALTASLSDVGLDIAPGGAAVTVTGIGRDAAAIAPGILTSTPTTDLIVGADLRPRLAQLTAVGALARGAGIDLDSGLIVTNGPRTFTIDLGTAQTVQDIVNAINNAGVFIRASINEAGTGIDVFNEVSGTSLTIGENGGTTAADLGIRTLNTDTPLADLNFGRGITLTQGKDDLRVTAKNGSAFDVNLDDAVTVGDVVELINSAANDAGVSVTASLADVGNGICLTDNTGGSGDLSVSPLNQSAAAGDLGLEQKVSGASTELLGEDRNPARTGGLFSALIGLEAALPADNTADIAAAAEWLDPLVEEVTRNHGIIGARSQSMRSKMEQMEDAAAATEVFLSEVQDLDYAEVVTQLQQSMTQLQVSMQVSSQLLRLSLLDFLV